MTKLEVAIKACRNLAERGNPGAWGALADALESLRPSPRACEECGSPNIPLVGQTVCAACLDKRRSSPVEGAPEPLPVNFCPACGATDPRNITCPKCGRTCTAGFIKPERRTHQPAAEGKGEALPEPSDQYALPPYVLAGVECILYRQTETYAQPASAGDLAACLAALPEERLRLLILSGACGPMLNKLYPKAANFEGMKQRAEAAEARAEEAERLKSQAEVSFGASRVRELASDIAAARARVGTLETFIRNVTRGELLDLAHAEAIERLQVLRIKAALVEPTPSAPSPAVGEKRFVSGGHVYRHYGVEVTDRCSTCGQGVNGGLYCSNAFHLRPSAKESTPQDSEGEPPSSAGETGGGGERRTAGMQRFRVGDRVESIAKPRVTGTVRWCGTGAGACVGVLDDADGVETDFDIDAVRLVAEGDYRREFERKKGPNEQRDDSEKAAEAEGAQPGAGEAPETAGVDPVDSVRRVGAGRGVAPRGLTPAEAEKVAAWYRQQRPSTFCDWGELSIEEREFHVDLYRFAHSDGARSEKARVARVSAHIASMRRAIAGLAPLRGRFDSVYTAMQVLEKNLESLASELEGGGNG